MLAGALLIGSGAVGGAVESAGEPSASGRADVSVTLVTGDRVVLPGGRAERVRVVPGEGREHIDFQVQRTDGDLRIVPSDAAPLLARGQLDRRLFDVTGLVADGYDDATRDDIPVIAAATPGDPAAERAAAPAAPTASEAPEAAGAALSAAGASEPMPLPAVGGAAAVVPKDSAGQFWAGLTSGVPQARALDVGLGDTGRLWLDGMRQPMLDHSTGQVGAPAAWEAGLTGEGVTVGVLDTGIDATHPDLAESVVAAQNFTEEADGDHVGHGTHVASIIAGTGAASDGTYRGMADGARLVDGKVCEDAGCPESAILAGMEWVAVDQDAKVVNMSLGGLDTPEVDLLESAVTRLTETTGALFVIAAGNEGPFPETVGSPASTDVALAVGAVDRDDVVAPFSSRGPRLGDAGLKPDITAPGADIVAARASEGYIGEPVDEHYTHLGGTSMATPHVAGAAAILAQKYPDWTPAQLKAALMQAAVPNPDHTLDDQGAGRLDIAATLEQGVLAEPASLSLGIQLWPHDDDEPVVKSLTYTNVGTEDVTLDLSVEAGGPGGEAVPEGMFTVGDTALEVPAGGSAATTLIADTSLGGADGRYTGRVVAASGESSVATTFAVEQEVESYEVTLEHIDRNGDDTLLYSTSIQGHDQNALFYAEGGLEGSNSVTVRLPKARYVVSSYLNTPIGDELLDETLLAQPLLEVTGDSTVSLDARKAEPVSVTVPRATAQLQFVDVGYDLQLDGDAPVFGGGFFGDRFEHHYIGHLGPELTAEQLEGRVAAFWKSPGSAGAPGLVPYQYAIAFFEPGTVPTGFQRDVKASELATVRYDIASEGVQQEAWGNIVASGPGGRGLAYGPLPTVRLPGSVISYVTTDGALWSGEVSQQPNDRVLWSEARAYEAGRTYREPWNRAVFGPGLPPVERLTTTPPAWRLGDLIHVNVPLHSDGLGHGGFTEQGTSRTALYADDELVGETEHAGFGDFEVPEDAADYWLEASIRRDPEASRLSTDVSAVWTFGSEHVEGDNPEALPMSVVRFAPPVDSRNRVPARSVLTVPVAIQSQVGTPALATKGLTIEVSTNDGRTWRKVQVIRGTGGTWRALVPQQAGSAFVSVRATATDVDGNTVTQTIIRAWEIAAS